jgi:hypothetical protein
MVCSARPARCGPFTGSLTDGSLAASDLLAALLFGGLIGFFVATPLVFLFGPGMPFGPPPPTPAAAAAGYLAGFIAGAIAWVAIMTIIVLTVVDRCDSVKGLPLCASGAVLDIHESEARSVGEFFLPFTMMHDRVDVVTQSSSWPAIERNEAWVFCTTDPAPQTSEILRCYVRDPSICAAGYGAIVGGIVGGVPAIFLGAATAAAIGCATVILCILAILVAIIIVVFFTLMAAYIGSLTGRALSEDRSPTEEFDIGTGDYVRVRGNLVQRGFDSDANVLWWTDTIDPSGTATSTSHCDLDEQPDLCA